MTCVEASEEAARVARSMAALRDPVTQIDFMIADATRLPLATQFDVVLLLETMLAIEDKARLMRGVRRLLRPGGRFGLTLEAGEPLSPEEAREMPGGSQIWLVPESSFNALAELSGFAVRQVVDLTSAHAVVAGNLATAFVRHRPTIVRQLGADLCAEMIASHTLWAKWLASGRVRKLAYVLSSAR